MIGSLVRRIARDGQAIVGKHHVVGRRVGSHGDFFVIDGQYLYGRALGKTANQPDLGSVRGREQATSKVDDVEDGFVPCVIHSARCRRLPFNVIITAVVSRHVDENRDGVLGIDSHRLLCVGIDSRITRLRVDIYYSESVVRQKLLQLVHDLLLDFRKRQAGNMDISIKSQTDAPVGPNQAFTRNWPAGESLEHFDEQEIGRFDNMRRARFSRL